MKTRELLQRIQWFVLGAISMAVLMSVMTVRGARRDSVASKPDADLQQQIDSLQQQVNGLHKSVGELWTALSKKADEPKPDRSRD
ncbi:MAG TPA: hypothetical protein VGN90_05055 [Pyrinomonadaceae bacterium]|jgi:uncharacterized protein YlxW (UPF0749 family)|nr:hypothetical protein [Pyrinomonadaceae bacterium]